MCGGRKSEARLENARKLRGGGHKPAFTRARNDVEAVTSPHIKGTYSLYKRHPRAEGNPEKQASDQNTLSERPLSLPTAAHLRHVNIFLNR